MAVFPLVSGEESCAMAWMGPFIPPGFVWNWLVKRWAWQRGAKTTGLVTDCCTENTLISNTSKSAGEKIKSGYVSFLQAIFLPGLHKSILFGCLIQKVTECNCWNERWEMQQPDKKLHVLFISTEVTPAGAGCWWNVLHCSASDAGQGYSPSSAAVSSPLQVLKVNANLN